MIILGIQRQHELHIHIIVGLLEALEHTGRRRIVRGLCVRRAHDELVQEGLVVLRPRAHGQLRNPHPIRVIIQELEGALRRHPLAVHRHGAAEAVPPGKEARCREIGHLAAQTAAQPGHQIGWIVGQHLRAEPGPDTLGAIHEQKRQHGQIILGLHALTVVLQPRQCGIVGLGDHGGLDALEGREDIPRTGSVVAALETGAELPIGS